MMPLLSLGNLASWAIQVLIIASAGALLPLLFRIRNPRAHLAYCYALLVACLALPFIQPSRHPIVSVGTSSNVELTAASVTTPKTPIRNHTLPWQRIILSVLFLGIAGRAGRFIAGLFQLRRYRAAAVPLLPLPHSVESAQALSGENALICMTAEEVGPVTFGLRRPIVLLPQSFHQLSPDAQCAVVCHELLHVKRKDWMTAVIEEIVGACLWFHPAISWLLSQTKLAREQVVDAEVIRLTAAPEPYIGALLTLAGVNVRHSIVSAPLFLRKRHLTQRMRSLMEVPMSKLRLTFSYCAMILVVGAAGWLSLTAFPLMGQPQIQESAVPDGAGISVDPGGRVLHRTPLFYPWGALQSHIEGTVVTALTLNANGEVVDARVLSGPDELRKDVLQAALQWHYVADGGTTRSVQVRVDFHAAAQTAPPVSVSSATNNGILETIDVNSLPDPLRTEIFQRVRSSKGQPFSDAMKNRIENAVNGADSHLRFVWGTTPDNNHTLRFEFASANSELEFAEVVQKASPQGPLQNNPLKKWLDEDVAYIISDEEKAAIAAHADEVYLRITLSDAERTGGNVVRAPIIISKVNPQYSEEARAVRLSGTVVLRVNISKEGTVQVVNVVRSLGFGLDEKAVEAVQQWVFEPATQNGIPVAVSLNMEVNFHLQ